MYTALIRVEASTGSGVSVAKFLILLLVLVVAVPLIGRLRTAVSKNRKRRWVEQGLMDAPGAGPESRKRSD